MGRSPGSKNKTQKLDTDYQREEKRSAENFPKELTVDFRKPEPDTQEFNANLVGLEKLADKLDETQKKILTVVLTDFSDDPESEGEISVFRKLRGACARAGMLDSRKDQIKFFSTIADPTFSQIVRSVGSGLIGIYIVPIVAKVIQQALEGDKTSQRWALQISGVMPDKYEFYTNRWQLTHNDVTIGELNLEGKSDEELKRVLTEISYDAEAEVSSD